MTDPEVQDMLNDHIHGTDVGAAARRIVEAADKSRAREQAVSSANAHRSTAAKIRALKEKPHG